MKFKNKDILFILGIFTIFYIIYGFNIGSMLIDFSRESYIPYKMLNGGVLFKDIFVIYGIFGYIINSLIYKINENFNLLIALSSTISLIIVFLYYFILKKFTDNKYIIYLLITGFISLSIFSNSTFSFILPYSYSTLWAVFGLYILLTSILYNKKPIAFLSLGLILANRIEFFIPAFIITIAYYLFRKEKILKYSPLVFLFSTVNIFYLIQNKVTFQDIKTNFYYIKEMTSSPALVYLYKSLGSFFTLNNFLIYFLIIILLSGLVLFFKKEKYNILKYFILTTTLIIINPLEALNLVTLPITAMYVIKRKLLNANHWMVLSIAVILSLKSIFKTSTLSYANFGFFILILCLYFVLDKVLDNKKTIFIIFCIYIMCSNIFNLSYFILNPKYKINTNRGTLYLRDYEKELFLQLNDYIKTTIKDKSFVTVPEGEILNFIFNKPHNFYNSTFTPLDFETFNEEKIIENFKNIKPEYVIFFPRNTKDYGKPAICYNYAIDFCTYIMDNYQRKKILNSKYKALIFERLKNEK